MKIDDIIIKQKYKCNTNYEIDRYILLILKQLMDRWETVLTEIDLTMK